jgi:putative restriction endonuclease
VDVTLKCPGDLFSLAAGDRVNKDNLFLLIQYSKQPNSNYWGGPDWQIANTPQQGINWVGPPPDCRAIIVKKADGGVYGQDGWQDLAQASYRYSFKKQSGGISYDEKANSVLIHQPQYQYPVLLFTDRDRDWVFEGAFAVTEIEDEYVLLRRGLGGPANVSLPPEQFGFREGGRRYVAHLLAERNRAVVELLKSVAQWQCDICDMSFMGRYGVKYIEAHHKVPLATYSMKHTVKINDFALLCSNCHSAVHIYMRIQEWDYGRIRQELKSFKPQAVS